MPDGTCRTIKSQYYKNGFANFIRVGGYGTTAVIEFYDVQEKHQADKRVP